MIASCWKGLRLPARIDSLKVRVSRIDGGEEELVGQLLAPLLAQVGRHDDQQAALSFGPVLGEQKPGLDGLAQARLHRPGSHPSRTGCGRRRARLRPDADSGRPGHPASTAASFSTLSEAQRLVSSWAKYLAW